MDIANLLLVAILVALVWTGDTLLKLKLEIIRAREYVMTCGLTDAYGNSRIEEIVGDLNTLILAIQTLDRK